MSLVVKREYKERRQGENKANYYLFFLNALKCKKVTINNPVTSIRKKALTKARKSNDCLFL